MNRIQETFSRHKEVKTSIGDKDATIRIRDLPKDTRINLSAGYVGATMVNTVAKHKEGKN